MTRSRTTRAAPLPGDHRPTVTADPIGDALARVYAIILSWPLGDAARRYDDPREEEGDDCD